MLWNENWEIITNATQTPFVFGNDTLLYDNFSQWKSDLLIDNWLVSQYRKTGLEPVLVLQVSKTCYETIESELQKNKSITQITVEDVVQRLRIFQVKEGMDIIFPPRKHREPYILIVGNYTQINALIKAQNAEREEYEQTLQNQQQFIQTAMDQIDSLRNVENFEAAILVLQQTLNQDFIEKEELIIEFQEAHNKMEVVRKELDSKKFNDYLQLANSDFEAENYAMAKIHLDKAQQIKPTSEIVLQKKKEIEKIESMLVTRKDSTFNYMFYNKTICNEIKNDIFKKLRNYGLSISAGDVKFAYTLHTDTLGQNISSYQVNMFSLRPIANTTSLIDTEETWSLFLETLITDRPIPAVKIDYLHVNAATTFQSQFSWKSSVVKVSNGGKIKFSPQNIPSAEKRKLETFFQNNPSFPSGKYAIEKKKIMYQDSLYTTLALKKVSTVGAEAMVYSMLFPGLGSVLATQGKKGKGIMASSLVFYGIGGAGFLLAKQLEKSGNLDSNQANIMRYGAWGSIAVGGVIHFSGIFVALKQGVDNWKKSRALKIKLKENAIYIQEFPEQIEL